MNPYQIRAGNGVVQPLLFSHLHDIFLACQSEGRLDLAIILPGNRVKHGQVTDAQFLLELIPLLQQLCGQSNLQLSVTTKIGWECDTRFLENSLLTYPSDRLEKHHVEDLRQLFPDVPPDACYRQMVRNQLKLLAAAGGVAAVTGLADMVEAGGGNPLLSERDRKVLCEEAKGVADQRKDRAILRDFNLILVGSSKANPVMANLCDDGALQPGETCLHVEVAAGDGTLVLRQFERRAENGQERPFEMMKYCERSWTDRNVGWVEMRRNPWAPEGRPRFLICVGGFYAQGTPAATYHLIHLCQRVAATASAAAPQVPAEEMLIAEMLIAGIDQEWRHGDGLTINDRFAPAHVVHANPQIPWGWFRHAPRLLRAVTAPRFLTPPSFEGSLRGKQHAAGPEMETQYIRPYDAKRYNAPLAIGEVRLLFANLPRVLEQCARRDQGGQFLDLAIILPGNIHKHGQSTDVQLLPELIPPLDRICRHKGLTLNLTTKVGWECDDWQLEEDHKIPFNFEEMPAHLRADLRLYFPDKTDPQRCYEGMRHAQVDLLSEAKAVLGGYNLLIIGSPKVNPVMVNLCRVFFLNFSSLGNLGMYLHPSDTHARLRITRFPGNVSAVGERSSWDNWFERDWRHRNIGWLHMVKNPWSLHSNRFIIYLGGIHAQGTPAAMHKLINICESLASANDGLVGAAQLLSKDTDYIDYFIGLPGAHPKQTGRAPLEEDYIPAHVVEANLDIPWGWFITASRPGLRGGAFWTATPPSYEGSIRDMNDIARGVS